MSFQLTLSPASLVVYVERVDGQRLLVCANVGDSDAILIPQNPHEWKRLSEVQMGFIHVLSQSNIIS